MTTNDEKMSGMPEMPTLKAGEHRERLKAELMAAHGTGARRWMMPRWMRVAAMVGIGALLMGAGAATKEAIDQYRHANITLDQGTVHLDAQGNRTDEKNAATTLSMSVTVGAATEAEAQKRQKEIADAIAAKKYKLVREMEGVSGEHQYIYLLTLADGSNTAINGTVRLEEVGSWEQWQKKQQALQVQRHQELLQAVKQGKARIVGDDVHLYYVCNEVDSGKKIEVLKTRVADGKVLATIFDSPVGSTKMSQTTSWQEHLDALAKGKRGLVEVKAIPSFTYEYPSADGKMVKISSGGLIGVEKAK